jgi:hypothetical protein
VSQYIRPISRPERVCHDIVKDAKRGNPDLASVVELHAGRLNRGEMLSVLQLVFVELASALAGPRQP